MASVNPLVPLILACNRGSPSVPGDPAKAAELQAACVARPELINTRSNSLAPELPLDSAAYWGHLLAVQALVAAGRVTGVSPIAVGGGVLGQAAFSTNPNLVQWIWDTGLDTALDAQVGIKALSATAAVPAERLQTVAFLLSKGMPVTDDMVVLACRNAPVVADLFVTSGKVSTDLMATVEPRISPAENPLARALLPDKSNALYVAISHNDTGALAAAIAAGHSVNVLLPGAARLGSPLHLALRKGHGALARQLLSAGADPASVSAWGQSIVGAAALSGNLDALTLAVHVAPPAAVDAVERRFSSGRDAVPLTACILARVPNVVDAVTALLAAGADPGNASTSGVPVAFWPSYQLQDVHASFAANFTTTKAASILRALAAGNSKGVKADLDAYNGAVRDTPRGLAKSVGVVV